MEINIELNILKTPETQYNIKCTIKQPDSGFNFLSKIILNKKYSNVRVPRYLLLRVIKSLGLWRGVYKMYLFISYNENVHIQIYVFT